MRARLGYPALKRRVVAEATRHNADTVLIEDKSSGAQLIQDLRLEGSLRPVAVIPVDDKVTHMHAQSAKIEARRVFIPQQAHWLDDFKAELLAFLDSRHDDQFDSVSQFLGWKSIRRRSRLLGPPLVVPFNRQHPLIRYR